MVADIIVGAFFVSLFTLCVANIIPHAKNDDHDGLVWANLIMGLISAGIIIKFFAQHLTWN